MLLFFDTVQQHQKKKKKMRIKIITRKAQLCITRTVTYMECLGEQQPLSALLKSSWSLPCQRNSMYVCSCPCFGGHQKTSAHTRNTCERRPFFFFAVKKKKNCCERWRLEGEEFKRYEKVVRSARDQDCKSDTLSGCLKTSKLLKKKKTADELKSTKAK